MDLDGTLLGKDGKVSDENARALRACEQRGIFPVLASGRSLESVREIAKGIGLNSPVISSNGTRVDLTPDGPVIFERTFPLDAARRIYQTMLESGLYFVCYGHDRMYQNNISGADGSVLRGVNARRSSNAKGVVSDGGYTVEVVADDSARMRSEGLINPYKFVAFSLDSVRLAALSEELKTCGAPCLVSSSWFDNVEVVYEGAGKGAALRALAAHLEIERDETMAFGDNLNDYDMLAAAGVAVAMGNAVPELKAVAHIIAPPHDQSGVGRVISEQVLARVQG